MVFPLQQSHAGRGYRLIAYLFGIAGSPWRTQGNSFAGSGFLDLEWLMDIGFP